MTQPSRPPSGPPFGYLEQACDPDRPPCQAPPHTVPCASEHLRALLADHSVRVVFQPIVQLDTGRVMGYEALGRGTHNRLSSDPGELFGLASQCNLAGELSRLLRAVALEEAVRLPDAVRLFINLHPSEMDRESLHDSVRVLAALCRPGQQIVLEVHGDSVADVETMRWLRPLLRDAGTGLAYDNFGTGQVCLAELAEVPPDFIKLDRGLVRDLDSSPGRRGTLQALACLARDLGVGTIAEGVETVAEARACAALGCRWGQGFLFGRPQPLPLLTTEYDEETLTPFRAS